MSPDLAPTPSSPHLAMLLAAMHIVPLTATPEDEEGDEEADEDDEEEDGDEDEDADDDEEEDEEDAEEE